MTEEQEQPDYDSVCSLMRMLEKEVEMKKLIQKKISVFKSRNKLFK